MSFDGITTSDSGLSPQMKVYYDRRLLTRALPMLLFNKFAQRRRIPRHGGKTIEFRKWSSLGVAKTALTEGVPPSPQSMESTAITATVVQQGGFVKLSDVVVTTTFDPILEEASDLLGEQAGETVDELIRDILVTGTNVLFPGSVTARTGIAATDTFDVAVLRDAVLTLELNRAKKIDGDFHAIIDPRTAHDIQGTDEWKEAQIGGERTGRVQDGSLGRLYGVKFWVTDKVSVDADGGDGNVDVYQTLIFGRDAYGIVRLDGHNLQFIHKALGSAGAADPLNQYGTAGWKCMFTTRILNDAYMVRVEHATSTGDNT